MRLTNLVASGDLRQILDLELLRELGDQYLYDTKRYHGGYIRLSHCKATVYQSGKYIFTGLKDQHLLEETWTEFIAILGSFIDANLIVPPTIRNMVFLDDLGRPLDLNRICAGFRDRVEYEPEQFPGLIYTPPHGKVLVFSTGKIIITGVRSLTEAEIALSRLQADIQGY